MAEQTTQETIRYALNVPVELNEKIEREADKQKRMKSQQCVFIIEKYFEHQEKQNASTESAQK